MADIRWENCGELSYDVADAKFEAEIARMRFGNGGRKPKLNKMERQILEFCHERDMKKFLKEEFEKHPIILDDDGGLVGPNPFDKEREEKNKKPYIYEDD